ncbi:MAG: phage holin family protein [Acidobacteria bacterium]|nr:phage holin family protein [Acidobacteriota bacterium]
MAASATGAASTAFTPEVVQNSDESLPSLVGRLGDDVMQLFDTKLSLLKVEMKEEVNEYVRDGVMIAAGGIIAAIGFALLNVALAFGISTLFANADLSQPGKYAIGFVSAGLLYLIVGGVIITIMKNRLAKQSLVPDRTVEELRKDKQWLKNEL